MSALGSTGEVHGRDERECDDGNEESEVDLGRIDDDEHESVLALEDEAESPSEYKVGSNGDGGHRLGDSSGIGVREIADLHRELRSRRRSTYLDEFGPEKPSTRGIVCWIQESGQPTTRIEARMASSFVGLGSISLISRRAL